MEEDKNFEVPSDGLSDNEGESDDSFNESSERCRSQFGYGRFLSLEDAGFNNNNNNNNEPVLECDPASYMTSMDGNIIGYSSQYMFQTSSYYAGNDEAEGYSTESFEDDPLTSSDDSESEDISSSRCPPPIIRQ